jgi:hypothetical protein
VVIAKPDLTTTYRQRHIVQENIEASGSPGEVLPHKPGNHFSLRDQLTGVELSNNALQDLVHDRWKNALIVVLAESAVDLREGRDIRSREHTTGNVDHLKVLRPC